MDEKKSNIRLVKNGGRRVTRTTTEYDWDGFDKRTKSEKVERQKNGSSQLAKKVRYQKKQKQRRLKRKRRQAAAILILTAVTVLILLFLTPIFNIRSVTVDGNSIVSAEQFQEKLQYLVGQNLLRTGAGKIRKSLKEIPYINTVEVQKKMFPPSVKIAVTEYTPSGILRAEGKNLLVNSELRVLSDSDSSPVPVVTGFEVKSYKNGEIVKTENEEKTAVVVNMLSTLETTDIIDKVIEINVNDLSDIKINYDDRIDVKCGTQLDMERKIRLLRETVMSNSLADNARGTMDLSEPGKAVYTP